MSDIENKIEGFGEHWGTGRLAVGARGSSGPDPATVGARGKVVASLTAAWVPADIDYDDGHDPRDGRRLEPGVYIVRKGGDVDEANDKWGFGYLAASHLRFLALDHVGIRIGDFAIEDPGTYIIYEEGGYSKAYLARDFQDWEHALESVQSKPGYPIWSYVRQEFSHV